VLSAVEEASGQCPVNLIRGVVEGQGSLGQCRL